MKTKSDGAMELREIFFEQLNELLDAEKQLVKALPKLARAVSSEELRTAMEAHLDQTEEHVNRLEQVLGGVDDAELSGRKCDAMKALIEETAKIIEQAQSKVPVQTKRPSNGTPALDAALIGATQKVEHYEIASYGTLCAWAKILQEEEAADLLAETLEEEKATDEELTDLAERLINPEAAEEDFGPDVPAPSGSNDPGAKPRSPEMEP